MNKQKYLIETDGTFKGTKLWIDDKEVQCQSIQFVGDSNVDYDLVIGLSQSKATKEQVKQQANAQDLIGFITEVETEEEYDEELEGE